MSEGRVKSILDRPHLLFIVIGVTAILLIPLMSAFESVLTWLVIRSGLYVFIKEAILPIQVRMVSVALSALGFDVDVLANSVVVLERGGHSAGAGILWNCVGWQTFFLLLITLAFGISGSYTMKSKMLCIALSFEAALSISFLRIILTALINFYLGHWQAVFFHDYLGIVFVLVLVFAFWIFCFKFILVSRPEASQGLQDRRELHSSERVG
ncbi:exosortase/archaeosortase family protein [Candidatus Bathyarchaeota archaeon]|nr:MAG: exosortase/archaeosortase family protein [Candidatus Bathyarchaeota archaeon]